MSCSKQRFDELVSRLGRPYCHGDRYAIYCGDCLGYLTQIGDLTIDLTITSPPYNIGKEYEHSRPMNEYLQWCETWINEVYRVTSSTGAFWLNLGYVSMPGRARAIPLPYLMWERCPFFLVQEVVWNYGAGVAARHSLSPRNEKFLWYVKNEQEYTFNLDAIRDPDVKYPLQKKNGKLRCNTVGKNPSDVWQIAKVTSGAGRASKERAPHPAQFPLDLIDRIVIGFSNEDAIVVDPFMGSGTTLDSCIRHQRYAIGFEVNPTYCRFSERRLRQVEKEKCSLLFDV